MLLRRVTFSSFFFLTCCLALCAEVDVGDEKIKVEGSSEGGAAVAEETVKIGNLSFPPSQQPGPLISFGQNLLDKGQAQAVLAPIEFKGHDQYFIALFTNVLYAFTNEFTLFISAPTAIRYRQDDHHSSGIGDLIIQLEYAFYTKAYHTHYDQATLVANVTIPTGSAKKNPSTGDGCNSFFLGGTYSRMEIDWFYFASSGGIMHASSHGREPGDQFLYQCGFGRRIFNTKEWLFDWMVELNGFYTWRDRIRGVINRDSGGNVIYLTPSLSLSSEHVSYQVGIGFPVQQTLFGHQTKNNCLVAFNATWTF